MDNIALSLGLEHWSKEKIIQMENEFVEELNNSTKRPIKYGSMHPDIKKSISKTLTGHSTSKETSEKISKTVSIRNSQGVCGFSLGHASKAGSVGGKSKSVLKMNNLAKNREKSLETIRGSVWMIHDNKRSRVPKNLVEQKISEGWKIGFRNV